MIIYIPVEVDTVGGTPIDIIRGLKMLPPPRPRAPEIHPPRKAKTSRMTSYLPSNLISPSTIGCPILILSACSLLLILTPIMLKHKAMTTKIAKILQSRAPHGSAPSKEGDFLDPRNMLTSKAKIIIPQANKCLGHCPQ